MAAQAAAAPASSKYQPSDFLKAVLGRPVVVKLNSGVAYRGVLACLDGYMNIAMEQTEEYARRGARDRVLRGLSVLAAARRVLPAQPERRVIDAHRHRLLGQLPERSELLGRERAGPRERRGRALVVERLAERRGLVGRTALGRAEHGAAREGAVPHFQMFFGWFASLLPSRPRRQQL